MTSSVKAGVVIWFAGTMGIDRLVRAAVTNVRAYLSKFCRKGQVLAQEASRLSRPFSVSGATGQLVSVDGWRSRINHPQRIEIDSLGRTIIRKDDDTPVYLVCRGTAKDFSILSRKSGFAVGEAKSVQVSLKVHSKKVRAQLVLLEFDSKRRRIGEIKLPAGRRIQKNLNARSTFVLPTLRLSGQGEVAIEWLRIEASKEALSKETDGKVLSGTREQPSDSIVGKIRAELSSLGTSMEQIEASLADLDLYVGFNDSKRPSNSVNLAPAGLANGASRGLLRSMILELARSLPRSNGSAIYSPLDYSVAIITDDFMYQYYKSAFKSLHYLSPSNYKEVFSSSEIDVLLYVTTWKGMEGDEWRGVKFRQKPADALDAILAECAARGIPTVFQSKEDPSNFDYFLPVAGRFDYIFTTDEQSIDSYRSKTDAKGVFFGEYGINPEINNPIGSFKHNLNKAIFAGSYPEKYPERVQDMGVVFNSVPSMEENLIIFDRNFGTDTFQFPVEYDPCLLPPIDNVDLQSVHKLFRYSLNFNSIKHSTSMCAMRVYQLQAQGKAILSNYALSVYNRFPGIRIVPHITSLSELENESWDFLELEQTNRLLVDVVWRRNVYSAASEMMEKIGLKASESPDKHARLLVVAFQDFDDVRKSVDSQRCVEVTVVRAEELRAGTQTLTDFDFITAMSSSIKYQDNYLLSRLAAFVYARVSFVTQDAFFEGDSLGTGTVHDFVGSASNRFLTVFTTKDLDENVLQFLAGDTDLYVGEGYAADPFGVGFDDYVRSIAPPAPTEGYRLSVIVPVFNNGDFLLSKCMPSLRRNKCYPQIEIVLVDDGSTDSRTAEVCADLADTHPNVVYFGFNDGGSGSASRPRNKGVEIARSDRVSFLDPDNEISPGGYDALLEEFEQRLDSDNPSEFVSGYQVKVGATTSFTGRHTKSKPVLVTNSFKQYFLQGKFPVVSTQAAVIDRRMLVRENISFVLGAAGQDTLYGWEVLANAKNPVFVGNAYIIYYAERSGSITNSVSSDWFSKCLILERSRKEFLLRSGLYGVYMDTKYEPYMSGWYLRKLESVPEAEAEQAANVLNDIASLYGKSRVL